MLNNPSKRRFTSPGQVSERMNNMITTWCEICGVQFEEVDKSDRWLVKMTQNRTDAYYHICPMCIAKIEEAIKCQTKSCFNCQFEHDRATGYFGSGRCQPCRFKAKICNDCESQETGEFCIYCKDYRSMFKRKEEK